MILYQGNLYETSEQSRLLARLEEDINATREKENLDIRTVINALDQIGRLIEKGEFDSFIEELQIEQIERYQQRLVQMLRKDYLECRLQEELGRELYKTGKINTPEGMLSIHTAYLPLGTLFHIAAGNMDGLPVFSVLEGLLTGNVNILKLPQVDKELSNKIVQRLIQIEPKLTNYIYIFDTPSTDLEGMKKMAEVADGIITWGGDEAISAVRKMAPVNARLIEWGHKLGFTYIAGYEDRERELKNLAEHIISTRQLLCSSCQVIYLNTDSMEELHAFCKVFLPYLQQAAGQESEPSIGVTAERTLRQYHDELEAIIEQSDTKKHSDVITFDGINCSLIAKEDSALELSPMFGNCIVKRLPKDRIFTQLRTHKRYLQTAGLICSPDERNALTQILLKSGLVRVMNADSISEGFCGETHDGEHPLSRYIRVVNYQTT